MTRSGVSRLADTARRLTRNWRYVGVQLAFRVLSGWVVALPVVSVLGAAIAGYPEGDAALFEPGGELLVEVWRLRRDELRAAFGVSLRLAALCALLGLWPLGMLLESFRRPRARGRRVAGRALAHWPALAAIGGTALLAQALVIAGGAAFSPVARELGADLAALGADLLGVLPLALGGAAALGLAVAADLGRIAVVRSGSRGIAAPRRALGAAARSPFGFLGAWALAKLGTIVAMAGAAALTAVVAVHHPGDWRVAVAAAAHLGVLVVDVLGRAAWLAWATLRLEAALTPCRRSPADRAAGTAGLADPSSRPGA